MADENYRKHVQSAIDWNRKQAEFYTKRAEELEELRARDEWEADHAAESD